jgi:hypothetical protein
MLRISERTLDTSKELCACFKAWHRASYCVNWTKLMQILLETGNDGEKEDGSANCTWISVKE